MDTFLKYTSRDSKSQFMWYIVSDWLIDTKLDQMNTDTDTPRFYNFSDKKQPFTR